LNLSSLLPEIILSVAALLAMVGEGAARPRRGLWISFSVAAVLAALVAVVVTPLRESPVLGMLAVDGSARFFKVVLLGGVLLVFGMSSAYDRFLKGEEGKSIPWGTFCALLLFSTVGLLFLVSATDFILILIALELLSITSFVMTGFLRERRSAEAAVKFFLVGAFSSALFIYGASILYGLVGSTTLSALAAADPLALPRLPLIGGFLFILAGFGFKLALVPFHMWVPDAYEGAPTPVTAYLSVAPKAAALGALLRVLPNHGELDLTFVLAVLAAVTMTLGNLAALRQQNVKRLLGYSSIAQMGYALVGFVAAGTLGVTAVMIYALAYLVMNLGAFACVIAVSNRTGVETVDGFSGIARRSLPLALATTVFMLSLTGLPPMVGFIGKFAVFAAAMAEGWEWLAVVGVLNSVVSLYYYFSIVHRMFFNEPSGSEEVGMAPALTACVSIALVFTLWAGLFPHSMLAWAQGLAR
jgi:NADH-quinone oxidoreductase subunit N